MVQSLAATSFGRRLVCDPAVTAVTPKIAARGATGARFHATGAGSPGWHTPCTSVDTRQISHDVGPRVTFSGSPRPGFPHFLALLAGVTAARDGRTRVLPFISDGGYDVTAGLTAGARVHVAGPIRDAARPLHVSGGTQRFLPSYVTDRIRSRQAGRTQRLLQQPLLPTVRDAMLALEAARVAEPDLAVFADSYAHPLLVLSQDEAAHPVIPRVKIALAAMHAGLTVGAQLGFHGFDTHSGHDVDHRWRLHALFEAIDFAITRLRLLGLDQRSVIMAGSDFGRTRYNSAGGKDHAPVTSMLFWGSGVQGGRVVGKTRVAPDDSTTMTAFDVPEARDLHVDRWRIQTAGTAVPASSRFTLTPALVHSELRKLAGIDDHALAQRFPLDLGGLPAGTSSLPIFREGAAYPVSKVGAINLEFIDSTGSGGGTANDVKAGAK